MTTGLKGVSLADDSIVVCARLQDRGGKEQPLVTPIYHASTYKLCSIEHYQKIITEVRYTTEPNTV